MSVATPPTAQFVPFDLERYQNKWEHRVPYNLAESGVQPLSVEELLQLTATDPTDLAGIKLGYTQTNGTDALREVIASQYPGATADNVLVTVGSSEANFVTCWALVDSGDRVLIQVPTYKQTWGIAQNLGASVAPLRMSQDRDWSLDTHVVEGALDERTKLIVLTNPNNPTGQVLSDAALAAIVAGAERVGAWILADEVYRGAELRGQTPPSMWGRADRVVVVGGLSKAYGLPGLRIGWVVGPVELIEGAAARHDYTVIGPAAASDFLAIRALENRDALLARSRAILKANWGVLAQFLAAGGNTFRWTPPHAGAICFVRYNLDLPSFDLTEHLRTRCGVLVVPGDHFDTPQHLRLGYGYDRAQLEAALERLQAGFRELA
jgi:aspartate/methionine/tyrosine aminotransferase